jgi:hypothetical protein
MFASGSIAVASVVTPAAITGTLRIKLLALWRKMLVANEFHPANYGLAPLLNYHLAASLARVYPSDNQQSTASNNPGARAS